MNPAPQEPQAPENHLPSFSSLSWVIFRDANRTLGGGLAAMELMRQTAIARGWLDEADNSLLVAASRLTPGTNVLAYCIGLGWKLRGPGGAAAAVIVASVPGAAIITALSATLVRIDQYAVVRALLGIGTLVAAALVLWSTWALLRPHVRGGTRRWTAMIAAVAIVSLSIGLTPVPTLIAAAALGAAVRR
jgi:chromate transporter